MARGDQVMVYVEGEILRITEKAISVRVRECEGRGITPNKECWFPKSQIADYDGNEWEVGDDATFDCPEWLAEEKDLI